MRLLLCLVAAVWLLGATGCEPPTRGCLDIEATNLDVSADAPCEDGCCVYPQLILTVNQEYDGSIWRPDTAYQNDLGQWFRVRSIAFYLSDFSFYQNGIPYGVADSLRMQTFGVQEDTINQAFATDVLLIRRIPTEYKVGTFRESGVFEQFECRLGLSASRNRVISGLAPGGHPLARQADSLWLNPQDQFVWMQMVVVKDSAQTTLADTLRFTAADFGGQAPFLQRMTWLEQETGFDFRINLTVNYYELFKGINFANSDQTVWKSKIISNLSTSFDVSQ